MRKWAPSLQFALVLGVLLLAIAGWLGLNRHSGKPAVRKESGPQPAASQPAARAVAEVRKAKPRGEKREEDDDDNDAVYSGRLRAAPEERDKDRDRDGEHPYDEALAALKFYAMKRTPVGATTVPVERYAVAREWNKNMPRFSSSLGVAYPAQNQSALPTTVAVTSWTNLGPGNIGGRVRGLVVDPTNPTTMYAGGVAGGVWKTTNGGGTWTAVGQLMSNFAVNSMAMDPGNSSTIYAGTGEGNFNIDALRGTGIFVTNDGGNNWSLLSSTNNDSDFYYVNKIVVSPVASNRVYAATNTGVFQSTNSGGSWTKVLNSSSNNGCFDLAIRTDNPAQPGPPPGPAINDYIIASCGTFAQAFLWYNTTADISPSSWTKAKINGSMSGLNNMGLTSVAVSPNNQQRMYALASNSSTFASLAILASTDGGVTWNTVTTSGSLASMLLTNSCATSESQGWYDNVIAVAPGGVDPGTGKDIIWAGGIDLYRSNDGGVTWGQASYWAGSGSHYEHADQHAIVFHPQYNGSSNTTIFTGSDGGVFVTTNGTAAVASSTNCGAGAGSVAWTSLNNNLGITQFYDGAVFPDGNTFFGGTQDNGTNLGTIGGGNNNWNGILGGDGGYVAVNPSNTSILYGEYTYGYMQKSTTGGNSWVNNGNNVGPSDSGFPFIAVFTMDPNNPQQIWTGSGPINGGRSGAVIWTTSNAMSSWTQASGTIGGYVSSVAVAGDPNHPNAANSNFVAVGTSVGTVYYNSSALSANSGTSWPNSTPRNGYVAWIAYDPTNNSTMYAVYSDFTTPHVFKSINGGASWNASDGSGGSSLPNTPVNAIVVNPANSQMIFVGTDTGVYSSTNGGQNWNLETTGFGDAPIDSLSIVNVSGTSYLYAFTHGYGVWRAPISAAAICSYTLSADPPPLGPDGGSGTATVTTQAGCSWTAVSNNNSWLTVPSGGGNGSGTGSGSFNWNAASNTGAARTGTITVSGQGGSATFTVNEAVRTYTISGHVYLGAAPTPLFGVPINLSGSANTSTTTAVDGSYSFTQAGGGNYTVTPAITGTNCANSPQSFTNLAANQTANFTSPNVIITTTPTGLAVSVNNTSAVASPISWCAAPGPGATLPVSVASPQGAGSPTENVWQSWSDSGTQSHSVVVPAAGSTMTYTATFNQQFLLAMQTSPSGAGTITPQPSSPDGYYAANTPVQLTAAAISPFTFQNWSGDLSGTTNPQTVTMSAPKSVTANFNAPSPVTVTTVPPDLQVIVDGVTSTAPVSLTWSSGTNHTLNVNSPQGSGGTINVFANWSDSLPQSHSVTAPAGPVVYTATFTTQYQLTTSAVPSAGGTIGASPSSGNGFYAANTQVQLTATPNPGYYFTGWTGGLSGTANPQSLSLTGPMSVTANFAPLTSITVTTSPSGLSMTVDSANVNSPQTFQWVPGSQHTIGVASPQQGGGTQSTFTAWSDGGGQSHSITVSASTTTYTASFSQQFLLTTAVSPSSGGSIAASPSSASGYYASGATVQLTANPASNFQFSNWSGDLSGSTNPQSITMNAPHTVTAVFAQPVSVTVTSSPFPLSVVVDGNPVTTPQTFSWFPGSNHTVSASSPQGVGTRRVFASWSDSGAQSHSITVGASGGTYIAIYSTQFLLTSSVSPSGGGSVAAAPASPTGDGYYDPGKLVQLTASTNAGFKFTGWSGDLSGTANPGVLTMNAPHTATANFASTAGITVTTIPAGLQAIVDGQTITTPQSFSWAPGTNHTLNVPSPQGSGGTIQVFSTWSDSGAQSHSVTAPASPTTYTATFAPNYLLTATASPGIGGTIVASPSSSNGYYAGSSSVQLTATANPGYQFTGWGGDLSGTTNPQSITMGAAHTVTANFTALTSITLSTIPAGLQVVVDGNTITTPQTLGWLPGSSHSFNVVSPQAAGTGARAAFASWSDGGAQSHLVSAPSTSTNYTATFNTQYLLTAAASPAVGGTVSANPPSSDGYYSGGTSVQLTAQTAGNFQFTGWGGDLSGSANPQSITMNATHNVTANFTAPGSYTVATVPTGLTIVVDSASFTAPHTFNWIAGSNHTVSVASPQGSSPRNVFVSWSDGGGISHSVTAPAAGATYTATFNSQFLLTTAVAPAGGGTVAASPSSSDGYYNNGTSVQLTAAAGAGYNFANWSGDLGGATNPQSITMSAAHNVTANFNAVVTGCTIGLSALSASLPATGTSSPETCPNSSGQPNCGVLPESPRSFSVTPSAACGAWTATSSNPAILAITAGASGSGPGSVSYTLLNNTHNSAQNCTITVASGTTSATYSVTEAGSGDTQVYREVFALYEQLLGRDPDAAGFAFWSGSGGAALGQMADAFLTSPEAFNTDFAVMAAYQAATGAGPTYSQFTAAVTNLRSNSQTVTALFSSLVGGTYSATTLYQNLLNRQPTASEISSANQAGLAAWFQTLIGYPGSTTPVGAANNEFQSTGTFHTGADHTNSLYIQMLYYVILGRNVDQTGLNFWLGIANQGGPGILFQGSSGYNTRLQILGPGTPNQGFIGSPEFQGLFAN